MLSVGTYCGIRTLTKHPEVVVDKKKSFHFMQDEASGYTHNELLSSTFKPHTRHAAQQ